MNVWEYPIKDRLVRGVFLNQENLHTPDKTYIFHRLHKSGMPLISKEGKRIIDHVKGYRLEMAKNLGRMKNLYDEETEFDAIETIREYLANYHKYLNDRLRILQRARSD